ncbi:hypothetical protein [Litchfieldia salsa]|uniref:Uncharacterized protein n=1 Tax=Litchfieldia salsa TaxID=930152 RepID=A0A1H0TBB2_9BACI|nr:hypothetical protein [Litchfieldia salsa]SDP51294.1 hypothetical protein SAMN05216565_103394 [Litchfieldia salsa]
MQNLNSILNYYIEGIMKEYNITDRMEAETILASALVQDKSDIAITDAIEKLVENET